MRKKILFGNWKMNNILTKAKIFVKDIPYMCELAKKKNLDLGVAPSYLCISYLVENRHDFLIYAQEVHTCLKGAFTGDISIPQIKDFGVQGSLVGHSERRAYHHETNQDCNLKIQLLIEHDMGAIYCVGETLSEYESKKAFDVIKKQIYEGLRNISSDDLKHVIIAYEPVWSIGTGKNASTDIAETMCKYIRSLIAEMFTQEDANEIRILYGGSVKPDNIHQYLLQPDVDGALVGGASLEANSFISLIENC